MRPSAMPLVMPSVDVTVGQPVGVWRGGHSKGADGKGDSGAAIADTSQTSVEPRWYRAARTKNRRVVCRIRNIWTFQ